MQQNSPAFALRSFSRRTPSARDSAGFTLIELMIVVVIIGVLSSLAIYSVTRYMSYTKTGEAREVIGSIMAGQESYFDETSRYLDVTGGLGTSQFYPHDTAFSGKKLIMWGGADGCTNCVQNYKAIGVNVGSAVRFRYANTTFAAGVAPPTGAWDDGTFNPGAVKAPKDGYVVVAVSDLTGDGSLIPGKISVLIGSSLQANIHSENPGE